MGIFCKQLHRKLSLFVSLDQQQTWKPKKIKEDKDTLFAKFTGHFKYPMLEFLSPEQWHNNITSFADLGDLTKAETSAASGPRMCNINWCTYARHAVHYPLLSNMIPATWCLPTILSCFPQWMRPKTLRMLLKHLETLKFGLVCTNVIPTSIIRWWLEIFGKQSDSDCSRCIKTDCIPWELHIAY